MQYLQIEMMCPNWIYFDKANIKLVDIQINSMNCKGQLTKIQLQVKIYKWKRIYFKLWRYLENHNWYQNFIHVFTVPFLNSSCFY